MRRGVVPLLAVMTVSLTACGSSGAGTSATVSTTGAAATTAQTTHPAVSTTSGDGASGGSLTVTGPVSATATFRGAQCQTISTGSSVTAIYVHESQYEVDFGNVEAGRTVTIPQAGSVDAGIQIRFSFISTSGGVEYFSYLSGGNKALESLASGQVRFAGDGRSGTFDLTLPPTMQGASGATRASGPDAHIVGSYACSS